MNVSRLVVFLLVSAVTVPIVAQAQRSGSSQSREAAFRCVDPAGRTRIGDAVPAECMGQDIEVLNERGTVVRVIEGDASRAARLAREAAEAEAQRIRQEQEQRDRMLLDTYVSVQDIERLRDQRLDLLEAQIRVTEQNIETMKVRQQRIEQQIARFKPYSDTPGAPPLPEHIAEELVNTVNSINVYREQIADKESEQAELRESFARDIARYRQLKTGR